MKIKRWLPAAILSGGDYNGGKWEVGGKNKMAASMKIKQWLPAAILSGGDYNGGEWEVGGKNMAASSHRLIFSGESDGGLLLKMTRVL